MILSNNITHFENSLKNSLLPELKSDIFLKKYYGKDKKDLKFIMVSSIFSEEHSEAIQIINI